MIQAQSKYIKSMLCFANINELERVDQNSCFVLQHFDYKLDRMLGDRLEVLNVTQNATLNLSIRIQPDDTFSDIYRAFESDSRRSFTVIFNGNFDSKGYLESYENALVVTGNFIRLEERFTRAYTSQDNLTSQRRSTLDIQVAMLELQYLGAGSSIEMKF